MFSKYYIFILILVLTGMAFNTNNYGFVNDIGRSARFARAARRHALGALRKPWRKTLAGRMAAFQVKDEEADGKHQQKLIGLPRA